MNRRAWGAAVMALATAAATAIAGAGPANAGQTWHQSTVRADPNGGCPESTAAELAQGWTPWTPSYESWPNNGQGGWTCTRYINWAHDPTPGSPSPATVNCVLLSSSASWYVNFGDGVILPQGSSVWSDSACSVPDTEVTGTGFTMVIAGTFDDADGMCSELLGANNARSSWDGDANLWLCNL